MKLFKVDYHPNLIKLNYFDDYDEFNFLKFDKNNLKLFLIL